MQCENQLVFPMLFLIPVFVWVDNMPESQRKKKKKTRKTDFVLIGE